jgi:hypothetical protein
MRTHDSKSLTDPVRDTADRIARALYAASNAADRYFAARGLDRVFFHKTRLVHHSPVVHVSTTQEIIEPFRHSSSLVARLPFTHRGLVFGVWSEDGYTEGEGLLRAVTDADEKPDDKDLAQFDTETALERKQVVEGMQFPGTTTLVAARNREDTRLRSMATDDVDPIDEDNIARLDW